MFSITQNLKSLLWLDSKKLRVSNIEILKALFLLFATNATVLIRWYLKKKNQLRY